MSTGTRDRVRALGGGTLEDTIAEAIDTVEEIEAPGTAFTFGVTTGDDATSEHDLTSSARRAGRRLNDC